MYSILVRLLFNLHLSVVLRLFFFLASSTSYSCTLSFKHSVCFIILYFSTLYYIPKFIIIRFICIPLLYCHCNKNLRFYYHCIKYLLFGRHWKDQFFPRRLLFFKNIVFLFPCRARCCSHNVSIIKNHSL